jgi:hypothetical protein
MGSEASAFHKFCQRKSTSQEIAVTSAGGQAHIAPLLLRGLHIASVRDIVDKGKLLYWTAPSFMAE